MGQLEHRASQWLYKTSQTTIFPLSEVIRVKIRPRPSKILRARKVEILKALSYGVRATALLTRRGHSLSLVE
jgi:hypothetical protein